MADDQQNPDYMQKQVRNIPFALDPAFAQWTLEGDQLVVNMISKFYGFTYDPLSKKYVKKEALMNPLGIQIIIDAVMSSLEHKGMTLSNMTVKEKDDLARYTLHDLTVVIASRSEEFGIKDIGIQYILMNILRNNVKSALNRPFSKGFQEFVRGFMQEQITIQHGQKQGIGLTGR